MQVTIYSPQRSVRKPTYISTLINRTGQQPCSLMEGRLRISSRTFDLRNNSTHLDKIRGASSCTV